MVRVPKYIFTALSFGTVNFTLDNPEYQSEIVLFPCGSLFYNVRDKHIILH